jgi:hypothetical protein
VTGPKRPCVEPGRGGTSTRVLVEEPDRTVERTLGRHGGTTAGPRCLGRSSTTRSGQGLSRPPRNTRWATRRDEPRIGLASAARHTVAVSPPSPSALLASAFDLGRRRSRRRGRADPRVQGEELKDVGREFFLPMITRTGLDFRGQSASVDAGMRAEARSRHERAWAEILRRNSISPQATPPPDRRDHRRPCTEHGPGKARRRRTSARRATAAAEVTVWWERALPAESHELVGR